MMCNLFVCQLLGVQRTRSNKSWMARFVHLLMANIGYFWLASDIEYMLNIYIY